MYKRQVYLSPVGHRWVLALNIVPFVVYCDGVFVMISTNTMKKIQLFQRRDMSWQLMVFSGRKLGQYADQELLKSLFQNKTPDLSLKYILIQVHDQQGLQ